MTIRENVARNERRPCDVRGCGKHRTGMRNFCTGHRNANNRHGHPEARAIRPRHIASERAQVAHFLRLHKDHESVQAASRWLVEVFMRPAPRDPTAADVVRARMWQSKAEAMPILETLSALALYETRNPHAFRNDAHFAYTMGVYVARLAPSDGYEPKHAEVSGSTRRTLGELLRENLGPFAYNVGRGVVELQQRQAADTRAMRQPFNIHQQEMQ